LVLLAIHSRHIQQTNQGFSSLPAAAQATRAQPITFELSGYFNRAFCSFACCFTLTRLFFAIEHVQKPVIRATTHICRWRAMQTTIERAFVARLFGVVSAIFVFFQ
jgi:hypothetical protein